VSLLCYRLSVFHPVSTLIRFSHRLYSYDLFDHRNASEHLPSSSSQPANQKLITTITQDSDRTRQKLRLDNGTATMLRPL
jgi:hypothetical protein